MLATNTWHLSGLISSHSSKSTVFSWSLFTGLRFRTASLRSCHRYSMVLLSGDWAGQSRRLTLLWSNYQPQWLGWMTGGIILQKDEVSSISEEFSRWYKKVVYQQGLVLRRIQGAINWNEVPNTGIAHKSSHHDRSSSMLQPVQCILVSTAHTASFGLLTFPGVLKSRILDPSDQRT